MLRSLEPKATQILGDLPPWYAADEISVAITNAVGKELSRIEEFLMQVRLQIPFPQNADDSYGILGRWEAFLGLPVEPLVPLATRQALVLGFLRKRKTAFGTDWEDAVSKALGTLDWSYIEGPGAYQVTITYPYQPGAYSSAQVQVLLRDITPAHLQILAAYSQGFLVGISLVGDPL